MNKKAYGVFSIALASLLLELVLIRVFDVLWYPNMAYMIITLAVFSFGLAGVYLSIRPVEVSDRTWWWLSGATLVMALCTLLILPAINRLPFDYNLLAGDHTTTTARNFFLIYVVICAPFFLAGFVLSLVFSHFAGQIRRLYFWDLIGAALGSIMLIPLLPHLGTVGTLFVVAAFCLVSSACFSHNKAWSAGSLALAGDSCGHPVYLGTDQNLQPPYGQAQLPFAAGGIRRYLVGLYLKNRRHRLRTGWRDRRSGIHV